MKKLISAAVAATLLVTSNVAIARDHRWGVDSNQHSPHHDRSYRDHGHRHNRGGVSTGEAVAIGLGALILGSAIANSNRDSRYEPRYEQRVYRRPAQYVCQDIVQHDYYGNPYVSGRNCWYQ